MSIQMPALPHGGLHGTGIFGSLEANDARILPTQKMAGDPLRGIAVWEGHSTSCPGGGLPLEGHPSSGPWERGTAMDDPVLLRRARAGKR
jgi:hypothetical protein